MPPAFLGQYWFNAILIPFLIFSLAALGFNILVGYCGQISLGTGGFMAVGAYASYKLTTVFFPDLGMIFIFLLSGLVAAAVGVLFGLPSLRIKGFYLAVATLAAQFFLTWLFNKVPWFYNYNSNGTIESPAAHACSAPSWSRAGCSKRLSFLNPLVTSPRASPQTKYLFALTLVVVFALIAKNLVRGRIGRSWMAIRDMDIAAELIGIRPMQTKLLAFAISSFYCGVAGAMLLNLYLNSVETQAFAINVSFDVLFMVIIGGLASILGSFLGAAFIVLMPIFLTNFLPAIGLAVDIGHAKAHRADAVRRDHDFLPDRRAAWASRGSGRSARRSCVCGRTPTDGAVKAGEVRVAVQVYVRPIAVLRCAHWPLGPALSGQQLRVPTVREVYMTLRYLKIGALAAAALAAPWAAPAATAQDGLYIPTFVYRTGAYAPNGIPIADGFKDYFTLLNERDGGIEGVKIVHEECETNYDTKVGVECYERLKSKNPLMINPYSTGITYALIPKASVDKIPILSMGYGRTDAAVGSVHAWVFNAPTSYWSQASAKIKYIASKEGGLDKLKGKKLALVYHNSPYGKEPIPTLEALSKKYGYELELLAVDHPGQEQKATWLKVRQSQPDWMFLWGWGVMNQVSVKEAAANGFKMDHMVGVWWSGYRG